MQLQYFKVLITVFYSQHRFRSGFPNWMGIFNHPQEDTVSLSFQSSAIHIISVAIILNNVVFTVLRHDNYQYWLM